MTITEHLMTLDPSLVLHNEGEWSNTISPYSAFNSGGVECEVGEFLHAFLRMVKPENVLETGTHVGVGASYMGLALKENKGGHLDTIEYLPENHAQAEVRMIKLALQEYVTCHLMDVRKFDPKLMKYQVVLLDTEPDMRFAEFVKFFPYVTEGGYIFIHDLGRTLQQRQEANGQPYGWPFGVMPDAMKELLHTGKARPFHFNNARGLSGFYKVHPDDYKL